MGDLNDEMIRIGRKELAVLSEILKGKTNVGDMDLDISDTSLYKAAGRLQDENIIENSSRHGTAHYEIKRENQYSTVMRHLIRYRQDLDENNAWEEFIGSKAAEGLVDEILPHLTQIADEDEIDMMEISSETLREDIIRPLPEDKEALKLILDILQNEFFTYSWDKCPSCKEDDCSHIEGFKLAKKVFLRDKLGYLADKKVERELEKKKRPEKDHKEELGL